MDDDDFDCSRRVASSLSLRGDKQADKEAHDDSSEEAHEHVEDEPPSSELPVDRSGGDKVVVIDDSWNHLVNLPDYRPITTARPSITSAVVASSLPSPVKVGFFTLTDDEDEETSFTPIEVLDLLRDDEEGTYNFCFISTNKQIRQIAFFYVFGNFF